MSLFGTLLDKIRHDVVEIDPREALGRQAAGALLLDVREADEVEQGQVPHAEAIPRGLLEMRVENRVPAKDREIVVYCAAGIRSVLAARSLRELGYTRVSSMRGGFGLWKRQGLPIAVPRTLSAEQRQRYSRHVLVPEVGEAGQLKLLDSKVLVVGAGGLGSPAALYLAAAGVGAIGLVDDDVVDRSNLQRQILHTNAAVGRPKTESGAATIAALNPDVRVVRHDLRLDASNVLDVIAPYDVILDGSDNFSTKFLVNDAAHLTGKPSSYGSIFRFEGQVSTFVPGAGPCYRCLYPEPTPPELAPSCDEAGVLGVLPGVIGVLQATEVIKVLLGRGEALVGRLLHYDALRLRFREFTVRRDPQCALCSAEATIRHVEDLAWSCSVAARGAEAATR
jgi:molybdopterin/thiamine biosynthesis adenylyltransferase/rhodanese-related sulfurtransferase